MLCGECVRETILGELLRNLRKVFSRRGNFIVNCLQVPVPYNYVCHLKCPINIAIIR